MKTRSLFSIGVAFFLLFGLLVPTGHAAPKPAVVGTDAADDWGSNVDPSIAPLGDALGQELVGASIGMADKKTVNFIISVNSLPPAGGVPEFSRYNWDFTAGGEAWQLTGAFTDYLRGVCNPLHTGACPPPQDPGTQPFFLRQGPCTVPNECIVSATIQATFDAGAGTITIPVPLEAIKAKPGSKIGPGGSTFGASIYAAPAAIVSSTGLPADTLTVLKTYTIPR